MSSTTPNVHEIKRVGNKVIEKYSIFTTDFVVYCVWEPSAIMWRHSTITTINGKWYGRIGSRPLPPEMDKIPVGPERLAAVRKWQEDQYQEAYNLIIGAFPEAQAGSRDMGEITLKLPYK